MERCQLLQAHLSWRFKSGELRGSSNNTGQGRRVKYVSGGTVETAKRVRSLVLIQAGGASSASAGLQVGKPRHKMGRWLSRCHLLTEAGWVAGFSLPVLCSSTRNSHCPVNLPLFHFWEACGSMLLFSVRLAEAAMRICQ